MAKHKRCKSSKQIVSTQDQSAYWFVLLRCFLCWMVFGFLLPWMACGFSFVKGKIFSPKNPSVQESLSAEPETLETMAKELELLERFLANIAPLERAAEDWYISNNPAKINFLERNDLLSVERRLECSLREIGPDKKFFVCSDGFFSLSEFGCDASGCGWILCRQNSSNGCHYSVVGQWTGVGRWDYSARVEKEARKLGRELYERKGWSVVAW